MRLAARKKRKRQEKLARKLQRRGILDCGLHTQHALSARKQTHEFKRGQRHLRIRLLGECGNRTEKTAGRARCLPRLQLAP